jgi:hypothetical protein
LVGLLVQDVEQLQYAVIAVGMSCSVVSGLLPIIVIDWFGMGLQLFDAAGTAGAPTTSDFLPSPSSNHFTAQRTAASLSYRRL